MSLDLREIQQRAYDNGVNKGWYPPDGEPDPERIPKYLAYMHSELSEILDAWRDGANITAWDFSEVGKPEGIPTEFADLVIWAASLAGYYGFDLQSVVAAKMEYNTTRPTLHGRLRA